MPVGNDSLPFSFLHFEVIKNQFVCYSTDRLVNDQISIAVETREHLVSQRHTFKRIQTRFNDISNRFPAVNSLLQRINIRKRRDSIILGLIIGFCTFLMLLYAFHWIVSILMNNVKKTWICYQIFDVNRLKKKKKYIYKV